MARVTILKNPSAECCATCCNWALASYCHHPNSVDDNEIFCVKNLMGLGRYIQRVGSKRITCPYWRREMIESDAVETYEALIVGRHV